MKKLLLLLLLGVRTFSSCATTYKAPGVGYNPYVTPDIYSGTMTFGIIY